MNITRRWCDLEFYHAATNVLIPCEDAKAREVSMTAASAPSHESPVRRRQTAGAGRRSRRQEQLAGADGRSTRQEQTADMQSTRFSISHFPTSIWGFSCVSKMSNGCYTLRLRMP